MKNKVHQKRKPSQVKIKSVHRPTMEASKECGREEVGRVLTAESLVTQMMDI